MLPYIYSLAGKVTNENYTIMRSLAFDFRNDENVYNIPDQYMFGPAFLVNPVTDQFYSGKNAGNGENTKGLFAKINKWYNFWTGESLTGGQTIDADAPIDIMPLYVKAGSIVPMGPMLNMLLKILRAQSSCVSTRVLMVNLNSMKTKMITTIMKKAITRSSILNGMTSYRS